MVSSDRYGRVGHLVTGAPSDKRLDLLYGRIVDMLFSATLKAFDKRNVLQKELFF